MAHTKAGGAAKRTVDVSGKRLGVKKFGGEYAKPGNIIIRQNGTNFHPGVGTMMGRDHTIFATTAGFVSFRPMTKYKRNNKLVDVIPQSTAEAQATQPEAKEVKPKAKVAAKSAKATKKAAK